MLIKRREFLKWITASATVLGLGSLDVAKIERVVAAMETTPIVWLQAAGCSGCSVSFLNMVEENPGGHPLATVDKLLMNKIDLHYHQNLMVASGSEALQRLIDKATGSSNFILIVEGAIPIGGKGLYCIIGERNNAPWTAEQAVKQLSAKAKYILAVGTCATSRGVVGMTSNVTQAYSVEQVLDSSLHKKIYNLPGCPVHPYIIGETIIKLLLGQEVATDNRKRPLGAYNLRQHHIGTNCPLRGLDEAKRIGVLGQCYSELDCKGKHTDTRMSCYTRHWSNKWEDRQGCFGAGNMCIGCSSMEFPFDRIYK